MNISRIIIRFCMIVSVLGGIYGFLHLPRFADMFKEQRSINILAWPGIIDGRYIHQFEKETGIKVYLTYFEYYEELLVKLKSGIADYDLIMGADYIIEQFIKERAVKKIDKSKFHHWDTIHPKFLNLFYDPDNAHSIPYSWTVLGIGIDKRAFVDCEPIASWKLIFDPCFAPQRVSMIDDARELTAITLFYLFGDKAVPTQEQLKKVEELLKEQKKWVVAYTDLRTESLLISQAASAAIGISSDIYRAMRSNDNLDFLIPQEGTFLMLDSFLVPASTQKDEYVYSFLNYLYQSDIISKYADRLFFYPVVHTSDSSLQNYLIRPNDPLFSNLRFIRYKVPEKILRKIWFSIKS